VWQSVKVGLHAKKRGQSPREGVRSLKTQEERKENHQNEDGERRNGNEERNQRNGNQRDGKRKNQKRDERKRKQRERRQNGNGKHPTNGKTPPTWQRKNREPHDATREATPPRACREPRDAKQDNGKNGKQQHRTKQDEWRGREHNPFAPAPNQTGQSGHEQADHQTWLAGTLPSPKQGTAEPWTAAWQNLLKRVPRGKTP
jgi:hypothetical protein